MSDEHEDPKPAADANEALQQAQAIRGRIDEDLRTLESRMPAPETLQARAKTYGGAAVAGLATIGALGIAMKRRSASRSEEKQAQRQAEALARALPEAALHVRQEHVTSRAGRLGLIVALAALGVAIWTRLSGSSDRQDPWAQVG